MRNVLFIIPTLTGGGAERVIVTLAKHLDRRRFRITLAVVDTRDAVLREEIPGDVEFIDLGAVRVRYAITRIIALVWRMRPDVLFSTLGHLNVALAMVRFLFPSGVRTVARETTVVSCSLRLQRHGSTWAALYRWFYRRHDEVICQSKYMRDDLVRNFRFPESRARVIHNPVDVARIRTLAAEPVALPDIARDTVRLVAAGRFDREKGFDLLIEALKLLDPRSVHLTLLGQGPLADELKQQVQRSGLNDRVCFAGFQKNPFSWFARADALVLSSLYEGFPNVVLEALACGTPVIAVPAPGGTREILDGIDQCVVAKEVTASSLADAINSWLRGNRSRVPDSAVDTYSVEKILQEYGSALCKDARV